RVGVSGCVQQRHFTVLDCVHGKKGESAMKWIEALEKQTNPLKVGDVAEMFGISRQKVYKMVANSEIPYLRIRGCIRFSPEQLIVWVRLTVIHPDLALRRGIKAR